MVVFLTYTLIGVIFNLAYDWLIDYLSENNQEIEENRFTMSERFTIIFFWPIALIHFLTGFFKEL